MTSAKKPAFFLNEKGGRFFHLSTFFRMHWMFFRAPGQKLTKGDHQVSNTIRRRLITLFGFPAFYGKFDDFVAAIIMALLLEFHDILAHMGI